MRFFVSKIKILQIFIVCMTPDVAIILLNINPPTSNV